MRREGGPALRKKPGFENTCAKGVLKAMDEGKEKKATVFAWMSEARSAGPEAWHEVLRATPLSLAPILYNAYEMGEFGSFSLLADELAAGDDW